MTKPNPYDWHFRPRDSSGPCPICGFWKRGGEHRAIRPDENRAGRWRIRCQSNAGAWKYDTIGDKPPRKKTGPKPGTTHRPHVPTPRVAKLMAEAATHIFCGKTIAEAARAIGVPYRRVCGWRFRWKDTWQALLYSEAEDLTKSLSATAKTAAISDNQEELIRLATMKAAKQRGKPLFSRDDGKQTLGDFLEEVYLPSRIELSDGYVLGLRTAVAHLNALLGKAVALDELKEPDICLYLTSLRNAGKSATTANNYRRMLMTLWVAAYDHGFATRPPRRKLIRRLPEEISVPKAWTAQECNLIFSAAARWPGLVGEIPAGHWWLSLFLTTYWTTCRIGAVIHTPSTAYDGEGVLVRERKTRKPTWHPLPESCRQAIERTHPASRKMLWPWPHHRNHLFATARRIIESAGVDCPKKGKNLFYRLRRTALSYCAAVDPALAQRQAGHADYATTLKHYIDPRIARGRSAADVLPEPIIKREKP